MMLKPTHTKQLHSAIRRQLRRDAADLVAFASDLIRIPSENPPGRAYDRCARWPLRESSRRGG
jgi:hypothetical protein